MPDPKKILVKVPKKVDPEKKETASENRIELTKDYSDAQTKMEKNLKSDEGKSYTEKAQGISIDKESMAAKPKMFKRKVITSGGDNGTTRIMSDDGNAVKYEGRSNMKATQDALRENKSQSKDTNSRRESNANYYNVNSGAKKNLDNDDKATLLKKQ
jgi:hypothetical protein